MMTSFHIVIPARYQSTRLPGKLLKDLDGLTVLERVYQQALSAAPDSIVIATDHQDIATLAQSFGAEVLMTSEAHQSGSDRIAEVIRQNHYAPDAIIVNVQADEPFIAPELIRQVAETLAQSDAPVSTLCWPISNLEMLHNPNVVKVVRDSHQRALYFSRAPIPFHRDSREHYAGTYRHIGLYAYRAQFLLDYVTWPVCELESTEALEQLRILWAGLPILVNEACVEPLQDINTEADLQLARRLLLDAR